MLTFDKLPVYKHEALKPTPSLDPWTLESQDTIEQADLKVVREDADEKEKVIEYKGVALTIPADVTPNGWRASYGFGDPVTINRETIVVRAETRILVIPRDKPHFKHGFEYEQDQRSFEFGDGYALERLYENTRNTYSSWDDHGQRFIEYASRAAAHPVASYNRIIWFEAKISIPPTFIDLHNPGKMYVRKDHITTVPDPYEEIRSFRPSRTPKPMIDDFRQCSRSRQAQQFIVKRSSKGLMLMDLGRRTVTNIQTPDDTLHRVRHIFPGYVKSLFHAR